jgi:hypothetical protein
MLGGGGLNDQPKEKAACPLRCFTLEPIVKPQFHQACHSERSEESSIFNEI